MKKSLTAAMAAVTLGGALCATAMPADARGYYHGGYYGHHHGVGAGTAVVAGIAGLAVGAAIADSGHNRYYDRGGYYDRGYYGRGYYPSAYYEPGYRVCEGERWTWDPYIHRNVLIRSQYAC